jgi:RNA polymerase sigma-70 factor (ECF subfamily)
VSVDRSLVERAQHGDREAFAQLALAASDRLFAVALRILRDHDRARDALQAALFTIWRDLPKLREPDRFEGWSYRIVANSCRGELRRDRRSGTNVELFAGDAIIGDIEISTLQRDELERAFVRLSVEQRTVLVLMYYRDLSVEDIAVALDISPGTVKSRLHAAREGMRAAIEADRRPVPQGGRFA